MVIQNFEPDEFFTAKQCARLKALMDTWRTAREQNRALSTKEQTELEGLVQAEVEASARRASRPLSGSNQSHT